MRSIDFSPIFRSSVGFDRMAQVLDHHLRATEVGTQPSYPPYNIERLDEDNYRVTMAVAAPAVALAMHHARRPVRL